MESLLCSFSDHSDVLLCRCYIPARIEVGLLLKVTGTWTLIALSVELSKCRPNQSKWSKVVTDLWYLFVANLVMVPTSNVRLYLSYLQNIHKQKKTLCCDESKCKYIDEIDQDTPASSASQFKEPGLKKNVNVDLESKFGSKIARRKWDNDYNKYGFNPRSEGSSHEPSALWMFCCFKYGNQFLSHSKLRSHLQNKHHICQNNFFQANFSSNSTSICTSGKILSITDKLLCY